jgi:3-keto-5-aminohexanoate cleavage enzyme
MNDFSLTATALGMGACYVRVGFEDGIHYAPGKLALTNSELIARAAALISDLGFELATPQEARNMLGIMKMKQQS